MGHHEGDKARTNIALVGALLHSKAGQEVSGGRLDRREPDGFVRIRHVRHRSKLGSRRPEGPIKIALSHTQHGRNAPGVS